MLLIAKICDAEGWVVFWPSRRDEVGWDAMQSVSNILVVVAASGQ